MKPGGALQQEIVDPVAQQAVDLIVRRSNEGALEYKSESILGRSDMTAARLMNEAIDEAVDQVIYLIALRAKLSTPRGL